MAIVYRIHPAIGVARLGNHETSFFVGPEGPGSAGVEIDTGGVERPLDGYKKDGRVKRQAARFRVFAYDQDSSGDLRLVGEVGPGRRRRVGRRPGQREGRATRIPRSGAAAGHRDRRTAAAWSSVGRARLLLLPRAQKSEPVRGEVPRPGGLPRRDPHR